MPYYLKRSIYTISQEEDAETKNFIQFSAIDKLLHKLQSYFQNPRTGKYVWQHDKSELMMVNMI